MFITLNIHYTFDPLVKMSVKVNVSSIQFNNLCGTELNGELGNLTWVIIGYSPDLVRHVTYLSQSHAEKIFDGLIINSHISYNQLLT